MKSEPRMCILTIQRLTRMQDLAKRTKPNPTVDYSPIWYSLDLFLSIVDLRMARYWEPIPERRWAKMYMRFHVILGWILIPIVLLALTGIIH